MSNFSIARFATSRPAVAGRRLAVARRRAADDGFAFWRSIGLVSLLVLGALLLLPG